MDFDKLNVSFYDHVKLPKRCDMPISRVLNGIRSCVYNERIAAGRRCLEYDDQKGYEAHKSMLPAVSFCGTFDRGHKADECNHYNNLLVIDIDKLSEKEVLDTFHDLESDPYVAAFWLSPSGRGYKGLVLLDYALEWEEHDLKDKHKKAFRQFYVYLLSNYGIELDDKGSDISRLCYMSADSGLCVKNAPLSFHVEPVADVCEEKEQHAAKREKVEKRFDKSVLTGSWNEIYGKATGYTENKINKNILLYIYKKLKKKGCSITDTWGNWVKVAFAIASSVHPEKGRELFLKLCRLDGIKHDEAKSERLIRSAYLTSRGKCRMSTIIYLAKQKGIALDR